MNIQKYTEKKEIYEEFLNSNKDKNIEFLYRTDIDGFMSQKDKITKSLPDFIISEILPSEYYFLFDPLFKSLIIQKGIFICDDGKINNEIICTKELHDIVKFTFLDKTNLSINFLKSNIIKSAKALIIEYMNSNDLIKTILSLNKNTKLYIANFKLDISYIYLSEIYNLISLNKQEIKLSDLSIILKNEINNTEAVETSNYSTNLFNDFFDNDDPYLENNSTHPQALQFIIKKKLLSATYANTIEIIYYLNIFLKKIDLYSNYFVKEKELLASNIYRFIYLKEILKDKSLQKLNYNFDNIIKFVFGKSKDYITITNEIKFEKESNSPSIINKIHKDLFCDFINSTILSNFNEIDNSMIENLDSISRDEFNFIINVHDRLKSNFIISNKKKFNEIGHLEYQKLPLLVKNILSVIFPNNNLYYEDLKSRINNRDFSNLPSFQHIFCYSISKKYRMIHTKIKKHKNNQILLDINDLYNNHPDRLTTFLFAQCLFYFKNVNSIAHYNCIKNFSEFLKYDQDKINTYITHFECFPLID